ncbi:hypothetical protein NUACC26_094060 [Scytonema sp. NUACC26]
MRSSHVFPSSRIILFQTNPFKTLIQSMPAIGKKIRIASTVLMLSSSVPLWITSEALAPQIVQAYTARADLSIDRFPEENYETLLTRAETAARAAAQRSFDQDILVTDVSIMVSVQNYGAIAPVLELKVSRLQWRTRPDPKRWATYFKTARSLLFFGGKFSTTPDANSAPPTPPASVPQNPEPKPGEENAAPPKK